MKAAQVPSQIRQWPDMTDKTRQKLLIALAQRRKPSMLEGLKHAQILPDAVRLVEDLVYDYSAKAGVHNAKIRDALTGLRDDLTGSEPVSDAPLKWDKDAVWFLELDDEAAVKIVVAESGRPTRRWGGLFERDPECAERAFIIAAKLREVTLEPDPAAADRFGALCDLLAAWHPDLLDLDDDTITFRPVDYEWVPDRWGAAAARLMAVRSGLADLFGDPC